MATRDDVLHLSILIRDPKSGKELNSVRIRSGQVRTHYRHYLPTYLLGMIRNFELLPV